MFPTILSLIIAFISDFKSVVDSCNIEDGYYPYIYGGFLRDIFTLLQKHDKKINFKHPLSQIDLTWDFQYEFLNEINIGYYPQTLSLEKIDNIFKCLRTFGYIITRCDPTYQSYTISYPECDFEYVINMHEPKYANRIDFSINGFNLNLRYDILSHMDYNLNFGNMRYIITEWKSRLVAMNDTFNSLTYDEQIHSIIKMLKIADINELTFRRLKQDEDKVVCTCKKENGKYACKFCDSQYCQNCFETTCRSETGWFDCRQC
jgi:hypothetical protein